MDRIEFSRRADACAEGLFRASWCILQNEADCEDAVQEALLIAWKNLPKLRHEEYFETWLTRILVNESRRLLRQRKAHSDIPLDEAHGFESPTDPMLGDALQSIGPRYALPLVLKHISGYTGAEIARILQIPLSTVK